MTHCKYTLIKPAKFSMDTLIKTTSLGASLSRAYKTL